MAGSVILNEQKVIGLLRQYIKEAELETSSIFADNVQQDLPEVPKVITSMHNEITAGHWSKALKLVNSLAISDSDLASMKYSICKQRYLESIDELFISKVQLEGKLKTLGKDEIVKHVDPEQLKLVATYLKSLEGLCSQEDYFKLSFLISCPDLKTHPSYSDWNVQLGRSQTASSVCQYAIKLKYPALLDKYHFPVTRSKRSNRLLQLVARGILYEKCEKLLLQHQAGNDGGHDHKHYEILDLHGWLAHLPGEAFQVPMHKLSLCIEEQCPVKPPAHNSSPPVQCNGHNHVTATPSTASLVEVGEKERTTMENGNGTAGVTAHRLQEVVEDDKQTKKDVAGRYNVTLQKENGEEGTKALTKYHLKQEIKPDDINGYDNNLQRTQKADATGDLHKRDIVTPENCQMELQPRVSSSTPKPSHGKQMVEFPVTSPIDRDKEATDYGPYHTPTSLRKQVINRNRIQVGRRMHSVMELVTTIISFLPTLWWLQ